jgi:hypothetical protein
MKISVCMDITQCRSLKVKHVALVLQGRRLIQAKALARSNCQAGLGSGMPLRFAWLSFNGLQEVIFEFWRHYATSWKVAGSVSLEITGFFKWPNPSSHTMAIVLTQPRTEMCTRNLPGSKRRPARKTDNLTAICGPIVQKMLQSRRLTTLWAYTACYRDSFTFFTSFYGEQNEEDWGTERVIRMRRVKY